MQHAGTIQPVSLQFHYKWHCFLKKACLNLTDSPRVSSVDRFTGRPGAYLRLINRWKLEEVSNVFAFPWDNNSKALWIQVFLNGALGYYCMFSHKAFNPHEQVRVAASYTYRNTQGNNTHQSGPQRQKAWASAFRCWANVLPLVPIAAEMEMEKFSVMWLVQCCTCEASVSFLWLCRIVYSARRATWICVKGVLTTKHYEY